MELAGLEARQGLLEGRAVGAGGPIRLGSDDPRLIREEVAMAGFRAHRVCESGVGFSEPPFIRGAGDIGEAVSGLLTGGQDGINEACSLGTGVDVGGVGRSAVWAVGQGFWGSD